jgi:WD40 repeat protein
VDAQAIARAAGKVALWDVVARQAVHEFESIPCASHLAWSPDGQHVASGCADGALRVWDTKSGAELHTLQSTLGRVHRAAWSPDGLQLAWGTGESSIEVWDLAAQGVSHRLRTLAGDYPQVAWSPDGLYWASAPRGIPGML